MAEVKGVELARIPIKANLEDIIPPIKDVVEKEVEVTLEKYEVPVTPPAEPTPLPPFYPLIPAIPTIPGIPAVDKVKALIVNIETTGFKPWKERIISIGVQNPLKPDDIPTVIMSEDEAHMLNELFKIIKEGGYTQLIGYGFSFDFRFIVIKAMKYGIACKEFADMEIYDLGQAMAQVKFKFVYFAQRQPKLSDIADFFWGYPKPFTDLEMIKYYKLGRLDKVLEFTSSQITRILLLYFLFRNITETMITPLPLGSVGSTHSKIATHTIISESKLTIPEAHLPETWTAKCPNDLSEWQVPIDKAEFVCPIDGTIIKRS